MTNDFKNRRTFSKPKLTKEEYAAKKKSEKEALYKMSDEAANEVVATSGNYQMYLDTQARLDRYSAINTLLIYHQFPNAAKLKSFEDWRNDNVKINKGAKSISILEPIEYTRNDGTSGISYNVKKMFDISQTSAKPNESQALNVSTKEFIMTLLENVGIEVESKNDLPYEGLAAYFDEKDQKLYVRPAVGDDVLLANHVAREVALVEFAANDESYSRSKYTQKAVSVAYMLCKKYGIEVKDLGIDRLPQELNAKEPKKIKSELTQMRNTLSEINNKVNDALYQKRQERQKTYER